MTWQLAIGGRPGGRPVDAGVDAAAVLPDARRGPQHVTTRARDGNRLNCRAGGIAHWRSSRFSSVMYWRRARRIAADARRHVAARFERAQLLLDLEREIEREEEELAAVDRAALVRRERRKVVADRHDRDRLRHPVHRHDVGQLGPVRVFLHVAQHDRQLARAESHTDWRGRAAATGWSAGRASPRADRARSARGGCCDRARTRR